MLFKCIDIPAISGELLVGRPRRVLAFLLRDFFRGGRPDLLRRKKTKFATNFLFVVKGVPYNP